MQMSQNLLYCMSLFSKGDFKIEESWNTNKPQDNKNKVNQRKSSLGSNNNQSLMRQLADSLADPSTDIIDDSLSRMLAKERSQHYNAIPKGPKQVKGESGGSYKKTPMSTKKIQSQQDTDLVTSIANRLQVLQKTCQSQRQQIKQQKQIIQKIKTQNAFLKGMKEDSGKAYQQMQQLKKKNLEFEKKVIEMQAYLKQYGLKWMGNKVEGKLDDKGIKKQIAQSKYAYRLPSQIDIVTIRRRVEDLNAGLQAQGMGTEIYNEKGVHKFRKAQNLPMGFYSNGIAIKGFNFYPYKSKQSLKILADLLDGYFPYVFKAKYPNGVLLQVVDHIEQLYVQQKKDQKITTLGTDKDFQPMSKQQFLNKLPQQIVKNGKVIPIRGQIQKMFEGKPAGQNKIDDENPYVSQFEGFLYLKTNSWQNIRKSILKQQDVCTLKIRNQNGAIYIVQMQKQNKIIDILTQLNKIIKSKFALMTNFPKRVYNGNQTQNLEQLGFYPNQNLHIQILK